jgi:hypothetical protein
LYHPPAVSESVKAKTLGDLLHLHGAGEILLVGEDKADSISQGIGSKEAIEAGAIEASTLSRRANASRVNHENERLEAGAVSPPKRRWVSFTTDIPKSKGYIPYTVSDL